MTVILNFCKLLVFKMYFVHIKTIFWSNELNNNFFEGFVATGLKNQHCAESIDRKLQVNKHRNKGGNIYF